MELKEALTQLETAQKELDPQFGALRMTMGALKPAIRLSKDDKPDALPMQKALLKLETAVTEMQNETVIDTGNLETAVSAFATVTNAALNDLAFDFAKDLRDEFTKQGVTMDGRPPTLIVGMLVFKMDIAARKGQWLYGKEPLTSPIPLSRYRIFQTYKQQVKRIVDRKLDADFLPNLQTAWQKVMDKRKQRPSGGRVNIIEVYSQFTLDLQGNRFWNQPSRRTFKEYEREFFVRDMVLAHEQGDAPFRLGVATKVQADKANRSIWIPKTAVDGDYYSDITFD